MVSLLAGRGRWAVTVSSTVLLNEGLHQRAVNGRSLEMTLRLSMGEGGGRGFFAKAWCQDCHTLPVHLHPLH